jgi:DNA-directed RNA polymerase specialized sigma24 family protein
VHELPEDMISRFEFAFLLEGLSAGDEARSEQFYKFAHPVLFRMAQKRRFSLSRDQIEDIIQETLLALVRKRVVPFDPQRGNISAYLLGRLLNARKAIRLQYGEMRGVSVPLEELKNPLPSKDTVSVLESRDMARLILRGVPDRIRDACIRVLVENEAQTVVATDIGLTRFALARKIRAVCLRALQMAA